MIPIRRGTAQRLGLRHPLPRLRWQSRPTNMDALLANVARVRASFEAFTRQAREAP